jgi:tetratricopeptide (TPR) repeat protein
MNRLFALAPLAGVLTLASPALAQSSTSSQLEDRTHPLLDQAQQMMRNEDFASAAALIERAIEHGASAIAWHYLAECNAAMSRYAEAVIAWDQFLAHAETSASPEELRYAREQRQRLAARCTRVRIRFQPDTAELIINGQLASSRRSWSMVSAPGAREVLLDPGQYRLTLRATGYRPWTQVLTAPEDGTQRSFDVRLASEESQRGVRIAGRVIPWWSFVGAGIAATGAAMGTTLLGLRSSSVARCDNDAACLSRTSPENDARAAGAATSFTIAAGGLILCVSGIVDGSRPPTLAPQQDFVQSAAMRAP